MSGVLEKLFGIFHISAKGFADTCLALGGLIFILGILVSIPGIFGASASLDLGQTCMGVGFFLMLIGIIVHIWERKT